jgi:tetratricopeptide (TPR) repeat protein
MTTAHVRAFRTHGTTAAIALFSCLAPAVGAAATECKLGVVAELPVKMSGGHALISGSINGVDAVFMADSGAFYSMLSAGSAEKFRLRLGPLPTGLEVIGIGGDETAHLATASDFDLVGLHGGPVHKIEFIVGGNAFARETAGLVGQNVLAFADTEYDLANGIIRLVRTTGCAGRSLAYWSGSQAVAVMGISRTTPTEPHIVGTATLNDAKIRVLFDTGAPTSFLTKRGAERAGVRITDPGVVTSGGASTGVGRRAIETWIAPFKSLDLGGEQVHNIKLQIADVDHRIDADLYLGADFFLSHRVYVANAQHKIFFTYNGGRVFDLSQHVDAADTNTPPQAGDATSDVPTDGPGFLRRGMAYAARKDYTHAIADFDRAAELDPKGAEAFYQRAVARWWNREAVLAMGDLDQALLLNPGMVAALMMRGELRLASNDDKGAAADFEAAEQAAQKDSYQIVRIGLSYAKMRRYESAITAYDRWLAANAKDDRLPTVLNDRCWARASWGKDLELALKDCDEALKRGQRSSQMLDSRGLVKLRLGDLDGAIADYKASLALQPKSAYSLYGLGIAKIRVGSTADGEANLQAAVALRPTIADEFKKMGITKDPR